MHHQEFFYWCRDAVSKIKYIPDRTKVYTELRAHLEDRYDSFMRKGMTDKEATRKTLEVMGDPMELAEQLAAIHKPYWGYALVATRIIAVLLAVVTLCVGINFCHDWKYTYYVKPHGFFGRDARLVASLESKVSDSSDGYTLHVVNAELRRTYVHLESDNGSYYDRMLLQVEVSNPRPWAQELQALEYIWAVDNFGNYHTGYYGKCEDPDPGVIGVIGKRLNLTTYTYDLLFYDASEDTQWVELHYDRDGRDLVLRVELTGGETP